ncbi:MAG: hypothetical protein ACYCZR_02990 [Burkholderiales bacterium]
MRARIDELEDMLHAEGNNRSRLALDARIWSRDYFRAVDSLAGHVRTIIDQKAQIVELATENGRLTDQLAQEKAAFDAFLAKVNDAVVEAFDYIDGSADSCDGCDDYSDGPVT